MVSLLRFSEASVTTGVLMHVWLPSQYSLPASPWAAAGDWLRPLRAKLGGLGFGEAVEAVEVLPGDE